MKLKPGWSLIYEDPLAGLFGRDGLPTVEKGAPHARSDSPL